ncbi:DUF3494 domain-containing protein [Nibribacter ruber]|uniref:DUF3494 domain-containing protein n=1 Tax=Nibribacter ruber TaxID=2698458 RepID=A0A6P1P2B9_9BACT|nr:ice-binding family protein [Nibribacter ruber]QHL88544.1 DUF3494 domain-containing protein [Nibribacter ruber]
MRKLLLLALLLSYFTFTGQAQTTAPALGKAFPFTVLAKTGVSSSGDTKINGNAGVAPSDIFAGFPPGIVIGTKEINTPNAIAAQADLVLAYNQAAGQTPTQTLTGQDLGGKVLTPGVYRFEGDANLTGNLVLDNGGNPNAVFIFQVKGNLKINSFAKVELLEGGAQPRIKSIFWQVAGNTNIGSFSTFRGTLLAQGDIMAGSSAAVFGRLLTHGGGISLLSNNITIPTDLEVTMTKSPGDSKGNYYVGNIVKYTVYAKNNGPIDESNVRVAFQNTGLTLVSTGTLPAGTSYTDNTKQWNIPSLANGATYTFEISYRINNDALANLVNTATIQGDGLDEVRENNEYTVTLCVAPADPTEITGPAAVCVDTEQTYSVTNIKVATQYNWTIPDGWRIVGSSSGSSIKVLAGPNGGNITVTAGNTCGLSAPVSKSVIVTTSPSPAPGAITASNGSSNPCSGTQNVKYTVAAIPNASTYNWTLPSGWVITAGAGTNSITVTVGSGSGDITVRAVNPCGPSEPSVLKVLASSSAPTAPPTIIGSNFPCAGVTTEYSVSAETGATYFNWTLPTGWKIVEGAGTNTIKVEVGSGAGSITVSGINGCGTSSTTSLAVTPTANTAPSIIDGPLTPCASPTGEVYTYTVGAVPGASSYFWKVAGGLSIVEGQGSASVKIRVTSSVVSGTLTVSALNTCGQSAEKSITISPLNKPARPSEITTTTTMPCAGDQNLRFSISPVAGATSYAWTFPTGWVISGASDGTTVTVRAGSTAGNVTVAAINSCGAGIERTLAVTPTLNAPEKPLSLAGSTSLCVTDKEVVYTIATGTDATGYRWEVPANWTIVSGQGTTTLKVNPANTNGSVKVFALNNCGESVAASLAVIVSTAPTPAPGFITTSPIAPCINQQNVSFSVDPIFGATAYEWTVTGDWTITAGQGSTTIKVTIGSGPGTVSVKARNGCGLSEASSTTIQPATTPPATPVTVVGRTAVCELESNVTYTVTGMTNVTGYTWTITGGNDWSITSGQGTASIKVKAGVAPAEISVVATNNCGQSSAKVIQVVTSKVAPGAPGAISGSVNVCAGNESVEYSVAAVTGATSYIWTLPTGWTYTQSAAGNSISVKVGSTSGKIKVRAVNGCGESTESEITVAPTTGTPPKPGNILAGTTAVCEAEQGVSYIVPPVNGASSYNWTVPADWTITSGQGTTTISVTVGKAAGNISVTAVNNCGNSAASTLAVKPNIIPSKPLAIAGEALPCSGSTGTKYVVPTMPGATSYVWTLPLGWTITSGEGTNSITVKTGTTAGEITVRAGNECGFSEAAVLEVKTTSTAPTAPLAITGNQVVCAGETEVEYKVDAIANTSSYNWTLPSGWLILTGQGTTRITVQPSSTAGNISVIAANGCGVSTASTLGVQVTGVIPPAPTTITGAQAPCVNTTGIVYTVGTVSGATRYTWEVPAGWTITSGQGTTSITVTTGTEGGAISVMSGNGCGNSAAKTIAVITNTAPAKPQTITGLVNACFGSTNVTYSVPAITGATGYLWKAPAGWIITSGQNSNTIKVTVGDKNGEISVIAQNQCGNSETTTLAVTTSLSPSPAPGAITSDAVKLICQNAPGLVYTIDAISTANSYTWTVPTGWTITAGQGTTSITVTSGTKSGSISVKAVNGCGESDASTLAVSVNEEQQAQLGDILGATNLCSNEKGLVYTVAAIEGATEYIWTLPADTDWKIESGQGTNSITLTSGRKEALLTVVAKNTCSTSAPRTKLLTPYPAPTAPTAINQVGKCGQLEFTVVGGDAVSYNWELPKGWTFTSGQGTNRILVSAPQGGFNGTVFVTANNNNGCSSDPISVIANPAAAQAQLDFSNALTPNGDGINDTWKIKNIESYPENELVIMNRWGSEVYRTKGYQNTWNGGELSEGTYFYVLKVKMCDGTMKSTPGYMMIIR